MLSDKFFIFINGGLFPCFDRNEGYFILLLIWILSSKRSVLFLVPSAKSVALGLAHFVALECFHSLLVFFDDDLLEHDQARLQVKETCFVPSLRCVGNGFNIWFTVLSVNFLSTHVFLAQDRIQIAAFIFCLDAGIGVRVQ